MSRAGRHCTLKERVAISHYCRESIVAAPSAEVFEWHARPGALERLTPPWRPVRVIGRSGRALQPGTRVTLRLPLGPFGIRWIAEHGPYVPGASFSDRQVAGPFAVWEHHHRFEPGSGDTTTLIDDVRYELPGGWFALPARRFARRELERLFAYRQRVTAVDLGWHRRYGGKPMKVAVTGATGLVGSALVPFLLSGGHEIVPLRRAAGSERGAGDAPSWDPESGTLSEDVGDGLDAVVHLAGENIAAGRWTPSRKARIRDSRVHGTRRLAEGLAALPKPPRTLVVASAIGFYGERGDDVVDESSAPGEGFLPDVCQAWEAAADPAREAGIRVVHLRIGIVLTPAGGALGQMLLPFRMGVGGVIGSGRQYMSWVALDDVLGGILHALRTDDLAGAVNMVAPGAVTNKEFTKTLGRVLRRPTVFPMPAFGARLAFGEMADALLLASTRVEPRRLREGGFVFGHPDLDGALRHVLGRTRS